MRHNGSFSRFACARDARRPASHHWCKRAANPAPAPRAPRRSACPDRSAGPASPRRPAPAHRPAPAGPRRRCCRSRPSTPLRDLKMSSGRKALPATAFSTAGISTRSRTFSLASITICASASTLAAPPMSFFMISMPLDGFRSSPPVSKHTPLPTSVTLGCAASPQVKSISRGARVEAMPTAWISGKFCFSSSSPTMQLKLAPKRVASCLRGLRQLFRPHVVGRRVDEVAREAGRFRHPRDVGGIDAVRRHQPDVGPFCLAVAAEAVAAEREGERGEARVMRRVGEAIDAGRQQAGQGAGPERVARFAGLVLEAEQHLRDRAVGRGQRQALAGLGGKAVGLRELPRRAREARWLIAAQVALVTKVIGMAAAAGAVSNGDCMLVSRRRGRAGWMSHGIGTGQLTRR